MPAPRATQVLTVNVGSSSVKLDLFRPMGESGEWDPAASLHLPNRQVDPAGTLRDFVSKPPAPTGRLTVVAHRIVHGGSLLTMPSRLTQRLDARLDELAALAPLHNPMAFAWLRAAEKVFPGVPHVLVPDTGFFAQMPQIAQQYALPARLVEKHGLRRYGFHGLAHEAMLRHWSMNGDRSQRLITLQLGAGCSMTAIRDGRPVDTSMGFTPLEGLMMATRSGDVDAGLVTWLQQAESLSPGDTDTLLNAQSGLLGVSGSRDMAQLLRDETPHARLAVDMYVYRARKYLGAYMAVLGGVDAILFGGGVGENAPAIRAGICAGMDWCGVHLDDELNAGLRGASGVISPRGAGVAIAVVCVDEARLLAEHGVRLVMGT